MTYRLLVCSDAEGMNGLAEPERGAAPAEEEPLP